MSFEINSAKNSLLNQISLTADKYSSKLLGTGNRDFASYLKDNFNEIDETKDNTLSKEEISKYIEKDKENVELKKILDNNSLESLMSNIDTNKDNTISYSEVSPNSNVPDILKSALRDIQTTKDWGFSAQNLTQKLCSNYYTGDAMKSLVSSAVSYLL